MLDLFTFPELFADLRIGFIVELDIVLPCMPGAGLSKAPDMAKLALG
jgi:hypothetical protein